MPQNYKSRTIAQRTRKSTNARGNQKRKGRSGGKRTSSAAPRVLANSLFALKLLPKPGIEVLSKIPAKKRLYSSQDDDDYTKMYHELLAIVFHAMKELKGEVTKFDPLANGMDIGMSFNYVLKLFKNNILPDGFEFNIDRSDIGYHFVIYKNCSFNAYWHVFELCPVVTYLKKYNVELHDLFVDLMRSFMIKKQIPAWYNGALGYAEYMLEDKVQNWEHENFDDEEESYLELQKTEECIKSYSEGLVSEYEQKLRSSKIHTSVYFLKMLKKIKTRNVKIKAIIGWMEAAALFMEKTGSVEDFNYYESEDEDETGVRFDQQASIIWDIDDPFSTLEMECLDSEAQAIGIKYPILYKIICKRTKANDLQGIDELINWPKTLTTINRKYCKVVEKLKK